MLSIVYLWSEADPARKSMNNQPIEDDKMPEDVDFGKGVRGLHHIPAGAKAFCRLRLSEACGNTSPVKPNKRESTWRTS